MRSNKNIALIKTIPRSKHRALLAFAELKFVNVRKAVLRLLEFLINTRNVAAMDRRKCWESLYEGPFDAKLWAKYNSYLRSIILRFIAQEELERNQVRKYELLMEYFKTHSVRGEFESARRSFMKSTNKMSRDASFYANKLIGQEAEHYHASIANKRLSEVDISATMLALDEFFLVKKITTLLLP